VSEAFSDLTPVWRMGVIVGAILVLATGVLALLSVVRPGAYLAELWARTRSWWIMAAVFFAAAALGSWASLALFAFMSFWAMKEYVTLLPTRTADHAALVLAFLSIPVQYLWVAIDWYGMFIVFIPVYMFLILPIRLVLSKETSGFVASASQIQWGLMAFVFGLSHMSYLSRLRPAAPGGTSADAGSLLLFLVFVVETSDVLQFVWGKTLGRRRVVPTVSPNKTWGGLIGGVLSASGLALLLRFLTPFSAPETFGVALLITIAGFFGGTVMSAVKRDFGVKDFGELIPGHGGMLDRLDGLCYAAPVFFHYVRYFHT
jgi:phosphatidate cytidylyltransferase